MKRRVEVSGWIERTEVGEGWMERMERGSRCIERT